MNKPLREKLIAAADFIEQIPRKQFNMGYWWLADGMAFDDDRNIMYRVTDSPCGCAVGHMIQSGLFGLFRADLAMRAGDLQARRKVFERIGKAFRVDSDTAAFMFEQYRYQPLVKPVTPRMVAGRVRQVAALAKNDVD